MMVAHGRDISAYDSGVNYAAYDFVIGKFTEGSDYIAPGALDRARATRAAGKVFSAYHFAQPGDGAQQADHFLSVEAPRLGDMPGWLDYEVSGLGIGFVNAFTDRYHSRTGYWPGVYVNLSTYLGELRSGSGWRRPGQRLWIARYGAPSPGVACDIWQYQGDPDLDVAYTPLSEMVIGDGSGSSEESRMDTVVLADGTVVLFLIDVNGNLAISLDRGDHYTVASKNTYLAGVTARPFRSGALCLARDREHGIHLLHVPNPKTPAVGFVDQPVGGTSSNTPNLEVLADETLLLFCRSTLVSDAGRPYRKVINKDGTVREWEPAAQGRIL